MNKPFKVMSTASVAAVAASSFVAVAPVSASADAQIDDVNFEIDGETVTESTDNLNYLKSNPDADNYSTYFDNDGNLKNPIETVEVNDETYDPDALNFEKGQNPEGTIGDWIDAADPVTSDVSVESVSAINATSVSVDFGDTEVAEDDLKDTSVIVTADDKDLTATYEAESLDDGKATFVLSDEELSQDTKYTVTSDDFDISNDSFIFQSEAFEEAESAVSDLEAFVSSPEEAEELVDNNDKREDATSAYVNATNAINNVKGDAAENLDNRAENANDIIIATSFVNGLQNATEDLTNDNIDNANIKLTSAKGSVDALEDGDIKDALNALIEKESDKIDAFEEDEVVVEYTANDDVKNLADEVSYDNGQFTLPQELDNFTFEDGDAEVTATKEDGEWTFETEAGEIDPSATAEVSYDVTDEVKAISNDNVTFEDGTFTIKGDVTEFTFEDGEKEVEASYENQEWTFTADGEDLTPATEKVEYEASSEVSAATEDVEYSDGEFLVPSGVESFTFEDGDAEVTATKADGEWTFETDKTEITGGTPSEINVDIEDKTFPSDEGEQEIGYSILDENENDITDNVDAENISVNATNNALSVDDKGNLKFDPSETGENNFVRAKIVVETEDGEIKSDFFNVRSEEREPVAFDSDWTITENENDFDEDDSFDDYEQKTTVNMNDDGDVNSYQYLHPSFKDQFGESIALGDELDVDYNALNAPDYAIVDTSNGKITPKGAGTAVVEATLKDGDETVDTEKFEVEVQEAAELNELNINQDSVDIVNDSDEEIDVETLDQYGNNIDEDLEIDDSYDSDLINVSEDSSTITITGKDVGEGTTTVTVKAGDLEKDIDVNVKQADFDNPAAYEISDSSFESELFTEPGDDQASEMTPKVKAVDEDGSIIPGDVENGSFIVEDAEGNDITDDVTEIGGETISADKFEDLSGSFKVIPVAGTLPWNDKAKEFTVTDNTASLEYDVNSSDLEVEAGNSVSADELFDGAFEFTDENGKAVKDVTVKSADFLANSEEVFGFNQTDGLKESFDVSKGNATIYLDTIDVNADGDSYELDIPTEDEEFDLEVTEADS